MNKVLVYTWSVVTLWAFILSGTMTAYASLGGTDSEPLSCEYAGKFEQCIQANRNGTTRSIKDFVCLASNDPERILNQIILDETFKEIDEEIMEYLVSLDDDVEFSATQTNRAIDDVTKNFWLDGVYYRKYRDLCEWWILAERATCTGGVPNVPAGNFIRGWVSSSECLALVEEKLDIYTRVADNVIKLNKSEFLQDAHKKYLIEERKKYDALLNDMIAIIGHSGRLARGMTHWTPNPLQAVLFKQIYSYFT